MKIEISNSRRVKTARSVAVGFTICVCMMIAFSAVSPVTEQAATIGDAQRGKDLFVKRCEGCHALDQDKEGPRLRNVYGRKAGSVPTFKYSSSLKTAVLTWNSDSLDKWLTDTESLVPDNDMDFRVPQAGERADIIQFLRVSSGK